MSVFPTENHPFADEALTNIVNDLLKNAPLEHNGAGISVSTSQGVQAYFAEKFDDHWSVIGSIARPTDGTLDYGVSVHGTWSW